MQFKKVLLIGALSAPIVGFYTSANTLPTAASHTQTQAIEALPPAKPGECFAKVVVPAQYKTEPVEIVSKEASVRYEVTPAQFKMTEEKVLIKQAVENIVPVPAVYETVQEVVELEPAQREWLLGRSFTAKPVGDALLKAVANSGIDLSQQPDGICLNEYYIPAQYETKSVKVLKSAGYEKIAVVPPVYEWEAVNVLVKEASTQVVEVPAVYESVTEKVMIEPATTQWKQGTGLYEKIDNSSGEIMCLIDVPATYQTVDRQILKTPATTKVIELPAEYEVQKVAKIVQPARERRVTVDPVYEVLEQRVKTIEKQFIWKSDSDIRPTGSRLTGQTVCLHVTPAKTARVEQRRIKTPASTRVVEIPAQYRTVTVQKLAEPAQKREVLVPALIETVQKKVKIADETSEWRQVLCETNITPAIVSDLGSALIDAGFDPGELDGRVSIRLLRAIDAYQRSKGLERGGLTLSTLESLGVNI